MTRPARSVLFGLALALAALSAAPPALATAVARVPLGGGAAAAYSVVPGTAGETLPVEAPGPAEGLGVSSLTAVPAALPLLLTALAGLAFLQARGRRAMRRGS